MQKAIQIAYNQRFALKCQYASEAGFKHIAVNFNEILDKTEDDWKAMTEDIQSILDKNGLTCVQSHLHCYDLLQSSEIPDERSDFAITQSIIATGALGGKYGVYHPRSSISTGWRPSAAFEDNRRILSGFLDTAVKSGVNLAVENIPVFPDHCKWPFYTSNFEDLAALVDSFNDPHICACWDFGHANLMELKQTEALRCLGSRLKCVHIHNNFGVNDDHSTPDTGNINWYNILPVLAEIGYNGPLTLETHCRYDEPELLKSFARHNFVCLQFLEGLIKQK